MTVGELQWRVETAFRRLVTCKQRHRVCLLVYKYIVYMYMEEVPSSKNSNIVKMYYP